MSFACFLIVAEKAGSPDFPDFLYKQRKLNIPAVKLIRCKAGNKHIFPEI